MHNIHTVQFPRLRFSSAQILIRILPMGLEIPSYKHQTNGYSDT